MSYSDLPINIMDTCVNTHERCEYLASIGKCVKNPKRMLATCKMSCGLCHLTTKKEIQISTKLPEPSSLTITTPMTSPALTSRPTTYINGTATAEVDRSINGSDYVTRTTFGSKPIEKTGMDLAMVIPLLCTCVVAVVCVVAIVVVGVIVRRRKSRRAKQSRQEQNRVDQDTKKMVEQDKLIYDEVHEYLAPDRCNTVREDSLSNRMNNELYLSTSDVIDYATFCGVSVEEESIYLTPISEYDITWGPVSEPIHAAHYDRHICQAPNQDHMDQC